MPKVSIIVPVFRVEDYLDRCVGSLVGQTLKDIEIILVDDGSPDGCPAMCDKWAQTDGRIRVIHKPNGGLGFARNSGIEQAEGEFIGFVDSDDYVKPDMFERLYLAAKAENAQIAMSGLCCIGGALPGEKQDSRYGFSTVKNIYSLKTVRENGIAFMSEREVMSEDVFFLLDFLSCISRAVGIEGAYYCYCRNGASLSKSYRADRFEKCGLITDGINERLSRRMPEETYGIYTDRLFQAYARAACMQEIQFAGENGLTGKELNSRLKKICGSEKLRKTLKGYPWYRLPLTQAAFALTMRYSLIGLQKLLVKFKDGR